MQPRRWVIHVSVVATLSGGLALRAQAPGFDAVSIKPHVGPPGVGGFISAPPGQYRATNVRVSQILGVAWDAPMGIKGLPKWASEEAIDVEVKWPVNTPRDQLVEMFRSMFAERMKLQVHYETVDDPSFALTVARADGRLAAA